MDTQDIERARLLVDVESALTSSPKPSEMVRALLAAVCKDYATVCVLEGADTDENREDGPSRAGQGRAKLYTSLDSEAPDDPERERNAELHRSGMRSAVIARFQINGHTDGILVFARDGARASYELGDVAIAKEVGARLTSALEHARLLAISTRH